MMAKVEQGVIAPETLRGWLEVTFRDAVLLIVGRLGKADGQHPARSGGLHVGAARRRLSALTPVAHRLGGESVPTAQGDGPESHDQTRSGHP